MAVGPFARIFAKLLITTGGAVGRAVMNAYSEAAARGAANPTALTHAISRRMTVDEAAKILEVDIKAAADKIAAKADHLAKANSPNPPEYLGSPYLLRKVENARTVLNEATTK